MNTTRISLLLVALSTMCLSQTALTQNARPRYKLVDLGTFGGPNSSLPGSIESLNPSDAVTGCADTSFLDPDFAIQNSYFSDPYIERSYLKSSPTTFLVDANPSEEMRRS
jgi:hypothetical protein